MRFIRKNLTIQGYLLTRLFSFPFWGIFILLPMILYKDLHATPLQITTLIALKPMTALISPYWSCRIHAKQHRLIPNVLWANIFKFLPFLFFPFVQNPWIFVFSFAVHMVFLRGTIPGWMEILKLNLPSKLRGKVCSWGSIIDYLGTALLPLTFGWLLDNFHEAWRWLFPVTGLLGIFSSWFILKIPNLSSPHPENVFQKTRFKSQLLEPWIGSWKLLFAKTDFLKFQIGFFLGGAGLMIMQPALPKYFVDHLHLSYRDMLIAIAACKGVGFALSSPFWVKRFNKTLIFSFCSTVIIFAFFFLILLIAAKFNVFYVYVAYLIYGVMQSGSELSWKMSGPVFSKDSDSSPYSSVNILAVGIRGVIFPYLGAFLCTKFSPFPVMLLGAIFCLFSAVNLRLTAKTFQIKPELN